MARTAAPVPAVTASVCLIHGDDDYAVKQRARHLYQQWSAELGGMDHEIIDAQVTNGGEALRAIGRLREALQTLPFFGGGKAVWLQNCNFLGMDRTSQSGAVTEAVGELAQELKDFDWRNVRLLISAGDLDKRRTFYKTIEKIGTVEDFVAWSLDDKDWAGQAEMAARKELRARKKEITEEGLSELIQAIGPHRQQLASELEKLSLYVGDRPNIEASDVKAIVSRNKLARAFAVAEALGDRDLPRLLRTLDEELWDMKFDKDKSEIGLLYGLISKVRAMVLMKEVIREGWLKPEREYFRFKTQFENLPAAKLPADRKFNPRALHPFVAHKALLQCGNYASEELIHAMSVLLDCNQRMVTRSLDEALVLQQTLVEIVRGSAERLPQGSRSARLQVPGAR
jgi:DNA polymerase-3 subunit delta